MMNWTPSLPQVVLSLCGVDQGIVILPELVVVAPQSVDLRLALAVGTDQALDGVLQLTVERVAGVERGGQVSLHCVCNRKNIRDLP